MRALAGREPATRSTGVDVARGLALVGMGAVHIFPSTGPDGVLHPAYAVAAGRSAALFAVLAGVGLSLLAGRARRGSRQLLGLRAGVAVRSGLLMVLGLALGDVDSPPLVILSYYALLFLVALPLLGLPVRVLALLAVVWAVLSPVASHLLRSTVVDPAPIAEPAGKGVLLQLLVSGVYPVLTWTTYLLVGLAVGRLPLRRRGTPWWLIVGGAVAAVGSRVGSDLALAAAGGRAALVETTPDLGAAGVDHALGAGLFGVTPVTDSTWLLVAAPHSGATLDLVGTAGSAVAVLGLALLVTRRGAGPLRPLALAGSMTLTLYTLHVIALRRDGPLLIDDLLILWLVHVAVALVLATVWRTGVGRGPLEAVLSGASRRVAARVAR